MERDIYFPVRESAEVGGWRGRATPTKRLKGTLEVKGWISSLFEEQ